MWMPLNGLQPTSDGVLLAERPSLALVAGEGLCVETLRPSEKPCTAEKTEKKWRMKRMTMIFWPFELWITSFQHIDSLNQKQQCVWDRNLVPHAFKSLGVQKPLHAP